MAWFVHLVLLPVELQGCPWVIGYPWSSRCPVFAKNSPALPTVDKAVEQKEEVGWPR